MVTIILALVFAWLWLPVVSQAAHPREEILPLVPDDVGFCLLLQDVRPQLEAFLGSDFFQKFQASPLGQKLGQSEEIRKLAEMEKIFKTYLQVDFATLRNEIFGDAVVFAYRPGPPGKPELEQGLFLVRARDPALLTRLLERLNQLQKQSGELKEVERRTHRGVEYFARVELKKVQFYFLRGPVLAFATQEEIMRQVIELDSRPPGNRSSQALVQLRQLGVEDRLAMLWINPRAFEPGLQQKTATAEGPEATVLQTILNHWKALEGAALWASVEKNALGVGLVVQARPEQLSPLVRKVFEGKSRPSILWRSFPENALLAVAGQVDMVALVEFMGQFLDEPARRNLNETVVRQVSAVLGKNLSRDVLPCLGPDWGLCVLSPASTQEKTGLPEVLVALRVRSGDQDPPVDRALVEGLNVFATLAVLGYNSKHKDPMALRTVRQDQVEVRYLVNDTGFPPGLKPAFALKNGFLVLATSPEAVRRFTVTSPAEESGEGIGEIPWLRLSLRDLAGFLKDRRSMIVPWLAANKQLAPEEAERRLDRLVSQLQLFERLELTQRISPGRLALTLRLKTGPALQK